MAALSQLKQIKYAMECSELVLARNEPAATFWALPASSASCARFVLDLFFNGSPHTESTHTYLIQSHTSRLSFSDVSVPDGDPSFPLGNGIAIAKNPATEVDWVICDLDDDPLSETSPHHAGITIDATLVTPLIRVRGFVRLDAHFLTFEPMLADDAADDLNERHGCATLEFDRAKAKRRHQWSLDRLRSVRQRRFQLEHSALEFFFDVAENVFLDFASPNDQHRVIQEIALLKPANFDAVFMSPPRNLLRKLDLTKQWQERKISNFQYLSALNVISGPTFQDLNQYPMLPLF